MKGSHLDVFEWADDAADEFDPLLVDKKWFLFGIDADADDEPVEESAPAADHVHMAEMNRVERPGVDGNARVERHRLSLSYFSNSTKRSVQRRVL